MARKKTDEEKAEIARKNGAKSAALPRDGYPKSEAMPFIQTDPADLYADIYNPKAKYAPELKIQAAMCYLLTGTVDGVKRLTGLDHRTISDWKNNSEWWGPVLAKLKLEKQDELDAKFTTILHDYTDALADRLEHGDEVLGKAGQIVKRKLSGRDIAYILDTIATNRAMVRGDPTSIIRKESAADVLKELKESFGEMAKKELNKRVIN